jgi:hypothetical protein
MLSNSAASTMPCFSNFAGFDRFGASVTYSNGARWQQFLSLPRSPKRHASQSARQIKMNPDGFGFLAMKEWSHGSGRMQG